MLLVLVPAVACSGGPEEAPPPAAAAPSAAEAAAESSAPAEAAVEEPSAGYTIVPALEKSTVSFVGTKNEDEVEVPGTFGRVLGGLSFDASDLAATTGALNVDLSSTDTGVEIRDLNIREALFGLTADAAGQADVEILSVAPESPSVGVGGTVAASAELRINILGRGFLSPARVEFGYPEEHRWTVRTLEPVTLSLDALGMAEQAAALKERCGHAKLGDAVRIEAALEFVEAPTATP